MTHPRFSERLEVGCICAGYMDGDIGKAKKSDREMKNRSSRRDKWLQLKWKSSKAGCCLKKDGQHITVWKFGKDYFFKNDSTSNQRAPSSTMDGAKLDAFDHFWPSKIVQKKSPVASG